MYGYLLGGVSIEGVEDIHVTVPLCLTLTVLKGQIDRANFNKMKVSVKSGTDIPIAFLNARGASFADARGASFADAFIIFPELTIFLQGKQSTVSRKRLLNGGHTTTSVTNIQVEFAKVKASMEPNDVFLHVTDTGLSVTELDPSTYSLQRNVMHCPAQVHHKLFGNLISWLRASTLESSLIATSSSSASHYN